MGLYVPPDVDLPDAPMWMIRTPRMSRDDVPDRMPLPGHCCHGHVHILEARRFDQTGETLRAARRLSARAKFGIRI
jgi:hypothetical protein